MYNILFALLFGLFFILQKKQNSEKVKKSFIIIMTFVLSLFSGMRNLGTGIDTYDYYMSYELTKTESWAAIFHDIIDYFNGVFVMDPGYTLFMKVLQIICPSFYVFNFFVSLVLTSAIGILIYKGVKSLGGYVIGYTYFISLLYWNIPNNLTRQSLAIGLILFAILLLNEKKRALAVLLVFMAVLFHKSALIGLIPILLLFIKQTKQIFLSSLIITPLVFLIGREFVNLLIIASSYERYLHYMDSETDARPVIYMLEMFFFYAIGFGLWKKQYFRNYIERLSYVCFAISVVFVSMLWIHSDLIRIGMYFSVFGVVYLPYCLDNMNKRYKRITYIIVFGLLVGRSILQPQDYKFFWEKVELHERYNRI